MWLVIISRPRLLRSILRFDIIHSSHPSSGFSPRPPSFSPFPTAFSSLVLHLRVLWWPLSGEEDDKYGPVITPGENGQSFLAFIHTAFLSTAVFTSTSVSVYRSTKDTVAALLNWFAIPLIGHLTSVDPRLVVVHNKGKARVRRTISFLLIGTASFLLGGYFSLTYAPPILTPLIMGSVPTDEETLSLYKAPDDFSREVDEHIKNCALAQSLRANPDFRESRPHLKMPNAVKAHNLTGGTLAGPGMIVVPPYYFNEKTGKEMVQIFYVGADVSGHPGIVHGGFIATMLDEGLARCAFPAMPNKVGVTANLQINYRKPTMAGQFLVLRAKTVKIEGRKAWAEGWIESLEVPEGEEPVKLVEASALFVEPKHAKVSYNILAYFGHGLTFFRS